ncbi:MAG: hypothetical protein Q8S35_01335, partial [bacterium]|nr:hypothetical protein [bacterium]
GNVGVGTSTPLGALHIDKNNNGIAQALLTNENTGSGAYAEYSVKTSAGNTWLGATGANYVGSGGADVANRNYVWGSSSGGLDLAAVNAAANLRFFTGGVAAANERMIITSKGNVGIGTTTPAANLVVNGTTGQNLFQIATSTNQRVLLVNTNGQVGIGAVPVAYSGALQVRVNTDQNISLRSDATSGARIEAFNDAVSENIPLEFVSTRFNFLGGNVGIGTTTPTSKLDVMGSIGISPTSLIGSGLGYAGGGTSASFSTLQLYDGSTGFTTLNNEGYGINLQTAGTNRLTITNAGNVGIGTTTPNAKLQVAHNATYSSDVGAGLMVSNATTPTKSLFVGYDSAIDASYLQSSQAGVGVKSLLLNPSGGNVGIGTITPTARLTVMGGDVHIGDTNFLNNNNLIFYGKDGAAYGETNYIGFVNGYTPSQLAAKIAFKRGASSEDGTLHFSTRAQSGSLLERMSITETGNVGIGTTTPETRLDVNGAARFLNYTIPSSGTGLEVAYDPSGSGAGRIIAINRSASSFTELRLQGAPITLNSGGEGNVGIGTTNPLTTLSIAGNGSVLNGGSFRFYNADNSNFSRIESPASGVLSISTGGVNNALYVANSGNIGIGTTNPSVPLQVTGDVSLGGLNVTTNSYSAGSAGSAIRLRHGATSGDTYGIIENLTVGGTTVGNLALNPNGGNVGIGTASPGEKLEVSGNIKLSTSASYLAFGNPSTPLYLGSGSALLFAPDNNEQYAVLRGHAGAVLAVGGNPGLLLNASGNVGIGTTTPATSLS